jgi:hypothetical protein
MKLEKLAKPALIQTRVSQAKNTLMALQGFGFACWFFDVLSTVFIINIKQTSLESNPLGWPLSALGALAYFIPITFVAYFLLFRFRTKETFYATIIVSGVSVFMGLRNLGASLYNLNLLGFFETSTEDYLVLALWIALIISLAAFNVVTIFRVRK